MSGVYLLGVDIGTQGTKTTLFDVDGKAVSGAFEPSVLIKPEPGTVEQDPEEIYASVIRTIKRAVESSGINPSDIAAIGFDGQMAGIMGIGADGGAVTPYDSWLDTRCEPYIELMKERCEEAVISTTGCPVSYTHGPKVLWWKYERRSDYKKIAKFVTPTAYVVGRLCGNTADKAYIDYTHLHFSGFGDVRELCWSGALLREFEVEESRMPDIVEPWTIIGGMKKEAAIAAGLTEGTPLVAGCGDQAATSLGAGITKKGQVIDVSGTTNLLSFCMDMFCPDVQNKTFVFPRSIIKGLWIPLAYTNGSGLCLKWFAENLAGGASLEELDKLAAGIGAGSDGLLFIPHFSGRVCPNNPHIRGSYTGLNWVHGKGHLYRAILESIGYEYSFYEKILSGMTGVQQKGSVHVIGGGSKSAVFNKIKADILNRRYVTLNCTDGAPLGSAVLAGYGVGVYRDFSATMSKIVYSTGAVEPDAKEHASYGKYAALYEEVIKSMVPIYKKLIQRD